MKTLFLDRDGVINKKPKPGMFLKAIAEYGIDQRDASSVGDALSDIAAAAAAGVQFNVLVQSAASEHDHDPVLDSVAPDAIAKDLFEAAEILIARK